MSMRDQNTSRLTICEVIRCINDRLQGESYNDTRDMLALVEQMAKKMAKKLQEYNEKVDPNWWVEHSGVKQNFDRMIDTYLVGDPIRGLELLTK
jgi:hypothetical protein